jgi:hypothetical protein
MKSYEVLCQRPSDINEHLPKLKQVAEMCEHVTEFGVRGCVSTYAFIEARPERIVGYDIEDSKHYHGALLYALPRRVDLKFKIESTLTADIDETDFLFIDTLHTYAQLTAELERHQSKVKKYLGFHDVVTFGYKNERNRQPEGPQGLMPAIMNFLVENKRWRPVYFSANNNGLLILGRNLGY